MSDDKGFGCRVASSFGQEKYNKKNLRRKQWNIVFTVILILLAFTVVFQCFYTDPLKTRAKFVCERINDYEVICKNG